MTPRRITLKEGADLAGFRQAVRILIAEEWAPQHVLFTIEGEPELFGSALSVEAPPVSLPGASARSSRASYATRTRSAMHCSIASCGGC
jgi:DNA polymerase